MDEKEMIDAVFEETVSGAQPNKSDPVEILSCRKSRRERRNQRLFGEMIAPSAVRISTGGLRLCLILQSLVIMLLCVGGVVALQCILDIVYVADVFPIDVYAIVYDALSGCIYIPFFGILLPILYLGSLYSARRARQGLDFAVSDVFHYFRKGNARVRRRVSLTSLICLVIMTLPATILGIGVGGLYEGLSNGGSGAFGYVMLTALTVFAYAFLLVVDIFLIGCMLPFGYLVSNYPDRSVRQMIRTCFGVMKNTPKEAFSLTFRWLIRAAISVLPVGVPFILFFYPSVTAVYEEKCEALVNNAAGVALTDMEKN